MKNYRMKFTWTLRLTILTPLMMLISIVTAGGGHGTPLPTMLCYPVFFLFDVFKSGGGPLLWAVLLAQFPMYGLMIDLGKKKQRPFLTTGLIIFFHTVLIIIAASAAGFWS